MQKLRIRHHRIARKVMRFIVMHIATGAVMIPIAIMILNEVAKIRGKAAVGSEYLLIALIWYATYRFIEQLLD